MNKTIIQFSIIIVNYNTNDLTSRCIESIYKTFQGSFEIIVVDNDSADNSVKFLKEKFPKITIIENQENEGFGRANNRGVAIAKGEYILLLNSDTWFEKLSKMQLFYFERDENILTFFAKRVTHFAK